MAIIRCTCRHGWTLVERTRQNHHHHPFLLPSFLLPPSPPTTTPPPPHVRGLEALLRVRERSVLLPSCGSQEGVHDVCDFAHATEFVCSEIGVLRVYSGGAETAHATAGASKGITGLLEVIESDCSKNRAAITATEESAAVKGQVGSSLAHSIAGESAGNHWIFSAL